MRHITWVLGLLGASLSSLAAPQDFGDGSDGPLTVSSDTDISTLGVGFARLTATAAAGSSALTVDDTTDFNAGDELMILNVIEPGGNFGGSEFHIVATVDSATQVTLLDVLATTFTVGGGAEAQVIEVPNFTDVTIQPGGILRAPAFGSHINPVGGVLALRATGEVLIQSGGQIELSGRGHIGGGARIFGQDGEQGESPLGDGATIPSANGGGGGGGEAAGISGGDGGGGGGHGTAGSPGFNVAGFPGGLGPGAGGGTYGAAELTKLPLGSGGGSGGGGNLGSTSGVGGAGGGAICIAARTITVEGDARCDGAPGGSASGAGAGGGGAGSGGSILLRGETVAVQSGGLLTARGASGGIAGSGVSSDGGSSGVGRIRIEFVNSFTDSGTIDPAPSTEKIEVPTGVKDPTLYR